MTSLHLAVLGFGCAGVFGKLIAAGPGAIVGGRALFATMAIAAGLAVTGRGRDIAPRGSGDFLGVSLGVLLAGHWWAFFQAIQVSSVGLALVSFSIAPILLLGMEAAWLRKWPGLRPALASVLALAGVAAIVPSLRLADANVRGMLWGVASGGSYALLALLNRPLVARGNPWRLTLWQNAVACVVLSPVFIRQCGSFSGGDWGLLAVLGVVFTAGTHGLFVGSMRTVPAHLAVLTCTLEPAYGMVAALGVLGEWPSPRTILGAGVVGVAVLFATRRKRALPEA